MDGSRPDLTVDGFVDTLLKEASRSQSWWWGWGLLAFLVITWFTVYYLISIRYLFRIPVQETVSEQRDRRFLMISSLVGALLWYLSVGTILWSFRRRSPLFITGLALLWIVISILVLVTRDY